MFRELEPNAANSVIKLKQIHHSPLSPPPPLRDLWRGEFEHKHRRSTIHTEIRMRLRFQSRQSFLVIVAKQLVQKVNGFIRNVTLIIGCDESRPWLLWISDMKNQGDHTVVQPNVEHTFPRVHHTASLTRCHISRDRHIAHRSQGPW